MSEFIRVPIEQTAGGTSIVGSSDPVFHWINRALVSRVRKGPMNGEHHTIWITLGRREVCVRMTEEGFINA